MSTASPVTVVGDHVPVRYPPGRPDLAVPEGADTGGAGIAFLGVFAGAGIGLLGVVLVVFGVAVGASTGVESDPPVTTWQQW
ncbi:hypothetical protein ACWGB8_09110 [Kitasatospora sp. NPDC054939]